MIFILIFWISIILLFHSYIFFPVMVYLLSRRKKINSNCYSEKDILPSVSILLSVFNEQKCIEKRVHNIFQSNYPMDKLDVWIGSDGSTDDTNSLLLKLQKQYPSLHVVFFENRLGKGNIINNIQNQATGSILVFTDAKVLFSPKTIFQLVKHFQNSYIGLVGGNIVNVNTRKDGISIQEKKFMSREMLIKYYEGKVWGSTMGAYGACFAIRRNLFCNIPSTFTAEDFYQTLKILENEHYSILELNAICYLDVPNDLKEEFRRKVRISAGNYQNLNQFKHLLLFVNPVSFCFFSHKVIRWIGPFLLISAYITSAFAAISSTFYLLAFVAQSFFLFIPLLDFLLRKIHIHIIILRFVTHFYSMNLALLTGFIKHTKGIKTNVWEPTTR